jgi:hypothetical protein
MVTLSPRDSKSAAKEAAAMPLPKEDTTPPVIKIYFIVNVKCLHLLWVCCRQGRQENFWAPGQKKTWPSSFNSPNNDTQTKSTTCVISKESVQQE